MSNIRYTNRFNNINQSRYTQEYANNEKFSKKVGHTPVLATQQQQMTYPVNMLNIPSYPSDTNPVFIPNMNWHITEENNAVKKFNSNATRSNSSSSSTSSSIMSSLSMYQSKIYNENSFYKNESVPDLLDFKQRNDLSKLFQDDFLYCPRSLLSKQDIQRANMLLYNQTLNHDYLVNDYNKSTIESSSFSTNNTHSTKFNPYTSKSFNPTLSL